MEENLEIFRNKLRLVDDDITKNALAVLDQLDKLDIFDDLIKSFEDFVNDTTSEEICKKATDYKTFGRDEILAMLFTMSKKVLGVKSIKVGIN